ncbi:MAG: NAD(P)H-dependent oxidoreductase [Holophagaceae bacterium]|nr:NAD(P)H-dependent oxidoreductase [Holophagaceae bacterium]
MGEPQWHDLGPLEDFTGKALQTVKAGRTPLALSWVDGSFGAISAVCNHAGGPLGEGRLDGEYVVCPWHNWKFHARTGCGEPGFEEDAVPAYPVKVEEGRVWVDLGSGTPRSRKPHPPHPLARPVVREPGPLRVVGLSTTVMDKANPRFSTSDALLETALEHAKALGAETRLIKLNDLAFRACEGYYSKSARACTWPCSITQMDDQDQMDQVYEALVHWGDVILLSTPIRWGAASSLYYRMAERMNCIQNQTTIADKVLIRNKVAAFIITGGQDNIQAVAGQLLGFFGELGILFPQFPYIAHSRGWTAEDMENNVTFVKGDVELHQGARELVGRALALARHFVEEAPTPERIFRGGRKAHHMVP